MHSFPILKKNHTQKLLNPRDFTAVIPGYTLKPSLHNPRWLADWCVFPHQPIVEISNMLVAENQREASAAFSTLAPYEGSIVGGQAGCEDALRQVKCSSGSLSEQQKRVAFALLGLDYPPGPESDFRRLERKRCDCQLSHLRDNCVYIDGPVLLHVQNSGFFGDRGTQGAVVVQDGLLIRPGGGLYSGHQLLDIGRFLEGQPSVEAHHADKAGVNTHADQFNPRSWRLQPDPRESGLFDRVDVLEFEGPGRVLRVFVPEHVPMYALYKRSLGSDFRAEALSAHFKPILPGDEGFKERQRALERLPEMGGVNPRYLGLKNLGGLQLALKTHDGLELVVFHTGDERTAELGALRAELKSIYPPLSSEFIRQPESGMVASIEAEVIKLRNPAELVRVLDKISKFDADYASREFRGSDNLRAMAGKEA
jgi:hypothetical protein